MAFTAVKRSTLALAEMFQQALMRVEGREVCGVARRFAPSSSRCAKLCVRNLIAAVRTGLVPVEKNANIEA
jgi:hypothetical protein